MSFPEINYSVSEEDLGNLHDLLNSDQDVFPFQFHRAPGHPLKWAPLSLLYALLSDYKTSLELSIDYKSKQYPFLMIDFIEEWKVKIGRQLGDTMFAIDWSRMHDLMHIWYQGKYFLCSDGSCQDGKYASKYPAPDRFVMLILATAQGVTNWAIDAMYVFETVRKDHQSFEYKAAENDIALSTQLVRDLVEKDKIFKHNQK